MPLVVPVLRLFIVFLNVYETFKTLKLPPLKRGGQPSSRALTQRKRELKGCLTIWIVWCCFAAYERTLDRIFRFIVPFHGEMKSVLLLFLLLTRAKGAEPLYLHAIRPFVRPYSVVLDPSLDIARDVGDFIFALLQVPMDYVSPFLRSFIWRGGESDLALDNVSQSHTSENDLGSVIDSNRNVSVSTPTNGQTTVPAARVPYGHRMVTAHRTFDSRRRLSNRQSSIYAAPGRPSVQERYSKSASTATVPLPHIPIRHTQTLPRNNHQSWYPPVSSYGSDVLGQPSASEFGVISPSTSGVAQTMSHNASWSVREYQTEEWRSYPAFPSAYPPTPLPAVSSLPSPVARCRSDGHYPPIPEDPSSLPGFHVTPERPSEPRQSSVRGSGKRNSSVQNRRDHTESPSDSADDTGDDSSHAGLSERSRFGDDSEVDFNTTLRTPYPYGPSIGVDPNPSSSAVSLLSQSTTLTTADNASSIHTRTSSGSDSSMGIKNRRIPSHSRNATLRGRPAGAQNFRDPLQSSASETADEDSEDGGIGVKRQTVLEPGRRTTHLRPVARAAGATRRGSVTAKLAPSARAKSATSVPKVRSVRATGSNASTIRGGRGTRVVRGKAM